MNGAEPLALPHVHLTPGELIVTREPQWVVTVLGSCVAVTMFDAASGLAAICHATLPYPVRAQHSVASDRSHLRYVIQVIPAMVATFEAEGVRAGRIETKIFGGANMFGHRPPSRDEHLIGESNLIAVRTELASNRIRIVAQNVGGCRGRKILFNTGTGEVLHQFVK